jgi:hypothetical protein
MLYNTLNSFSSNTLDMQYLSQIYDLVNPREIEEYINTNKHLMSVLIEVSKNVREYFISDSVYLSLEFVRDPEIFDRQRLLSVIHTDLSVEEAFSCLNKLYKGWWSVFSKDIFPAIGIDVRTI